MANILNLGLSAVATGVDTITATFSPTITLTDRRIVFLRTAGTNATTTPTFNPNGLGAQTITKNNGDALAVGDLDGDVVLMYDLANTNWELLTPKSVSTGNVTKIGTPVDNQIGVWTGDGTIEGDASFTFDTATNSLVSDGSLSLGTGSFLGFVGNTAVTTSNYSLFGNGTLTLLNARSGASISFRINNVDVANFSTNGGFGFGSTYYNIDALQNNMIIEGKLGVGTSAPQTTLSLPAAGVLSFEATPGVTDISLTHTSDHLTLGGGDLIISNLTPSEILITDGTKQLVSAPVSTYPSLTELAYVKGVTSSVQTQLNGKQATLTNPVTGTGTTNEITYFTAASTVASLPVATYPSLTELSYVKGVTSAIQTQINSKTSAVDYFNTTNLSVGDSTAYYIGQSTTAATTSNGIPHVPVKAGTVTNISTEVFSGSTIGSNESGTLEFFYNDGANSTVISNAFKVDANRHTFVEFSGLSISVNSGNTYFVYTSPALATNPTAIQFRFNVYMK